MGRSSLASGDLSSLPACAPFPQRRAISLAFPPSRRSRSSECANAHPTGSLAKNGAPFSVAPLLVRRPRFSLSAHRLRFPSLRGSRSSAVALAPPRFPPRAMRRAPIRLRSGVVGVRLSLKRPAGKKLCLACGAKDKKNNHRKGLGLIFEGFASLELQRPLAAVAIH